MDILRVMGGHRLKGSVNINGSKNAALPIMAASLMSSGEVILNDVPELEDISVMIRALESLGAHIKREGHTLIIDSSHIHRFQVDESIARRMRASNLLMGALLGRFGQARVAYPGGCAIGSRPMDIHIKGFQRLGYDISDLPGYMDGRANQVNGREIMLDIPSVGATENIMMAAVFAPGQTLLRNAAREPEIVDLQNFLNRMGARIRGAGLDCIRIDGVKTLRGTEHSVISDRIEAGTFMVAAALTRGDVWVENVILEHLQPVIAKLGETGAEIMTRPGRVRVIGNRNYSATDIKTMPYPGFPTDMQAQMMSFLCMTPGTSVIVENIFENRFMHVQELRRMGAEIKIEGRVAIISGGKLKGAAVEASDLRAGAALILAGLGAEGETRISRLDHLDRGYERIHERFQALGADIVRERTVDN
ncbi:MAG: UDP-N-acetylglucosamine 1-carboxyvinyltransferase [Syntrophomonadaceae bacterium]|nr:UDP-N-acetylglucosamine 1-carboxyvinyltransferase [Syntrophomonadaceae bacterium]